MTANKGCTSMAMLVALGSAACDPEVGPPPLCEIYGCEHPGKGLAEGGEIRFERVKTPGGPIVLAQAYFLETGEGTFPLPELGKCNKVSTEGVGTHWPVANMTGKRYVDVGPSITLSNGSQSLTFDRFADPAMVENVPSNRRHDILYAGPKQTATFDPNLLVYDTTYEVTYDSAEKLTRPKVYLPRDYVIRSPNVGTGTVTFTQGNDAVFEYESLAPTADVLDHDPERAFPFIIFFSGSPAVFTHVCLAGHDDRGVFTVPANVIAELGGKGVVLHGHLSHYFDVFKGRRFDLLGVSCNLSPYEVIAPR